MASPSTIRQADGQESVGLVFGSEEGLKTLRLRGHLTLMDTTHDSNWLSWLLYTVIVHNEYGS